MSCYVGRVARMCFCRRGVSLASLPGTSIAGFSCTILPLMDGAWTIMLCTNRTLISRRAIWRAIAGFLIWKSLIYSSFECLQSFIYYSFIHLLTYLLQQANTVCSCNVYSIEILSWIFLFSLREVDVQYLWSFTKPHLLFIYLSIYLFIHSYIHLLQYSEHLELLLIFFAKVQNEDIVAVYTSSK